MNLFKKFQLAIPVFISLFFFVSPTFAAAPDGLGPWADVVDSFHQGVMKNGLPVPAARSDTTAALGVAENTPTVDPTFFSLGFGGHIVLGLDNGISSGAMVIEATIEPGYPDETAKVEMSEDGITWVMAGNVVQDGTVNKPAQIACAKFVRITDTSDPAIMPDDIADGFDVDGVQATGTACTQITPSLTPTLTATPTVTQTITPTPTQSPTNTPSNSNTSSNSNSNSESSTTTSSNPTAAPTPSVVLVRTTSSNPCPTIGNPLIPCFPNTGSLSPRLPNTGIGPTQNMLWNIEMGFQYVFSLVSKLFT
ncbi:MAG TPA: hypothetical protein VLG12_04480 [Candidatus Saccharimonadales bacterium]|nr:hypothetical protein [Candidatus Saccharimonadales bacterium]